MPIPALATESNRSDASTLVTCLRTAADTCDDTMMIAIIANGQ
jgi:hypothetical protein